MAGKTAQKAYFLDNFQTVDDVSDFMNYEKGLEWHHFNDFNDMIANIEKHKPAVISIGQQFDQQPSLDNDELLSVYEAVRKLVQEHIPVKDVVSGKVKLRFHTQKNSLANNLNSYMKGFKEIVTKERGKA